MSGFTPLFFAVREGHIDVVRALLEAGVDVNETLHGPEGPQQEVNNASYKPVGKGTSPLLMAVENGHFELAIALVDAGADPNDPRTGFTPLHTMTWVRKPDASDTGDPSPVGSGRLTSLQFVRALVKRGATSMRVCTRARRARPTRVAGRDGRGDAVSDGCRPGGRRVDAPADRAGRGPLAAESRQHHTADGRGWPRHDRPARGGRRRSPKRSKRCGCCSTLARTSTRSTTTATRAMHGAAFGNFPTIVQLLADRGASADIWKRPDKLGRTPLFIAEGYRGGPLRPSRPTLDAITGLMLARGLSMEGPRPLGVVRDTYEKPAAVPAKKQ